MKSDNQKVLEYLSKDLTLTCYQAKQLLNVQDLRSRISNLKAKGYRISREMRKGIRKDGRPSRFAEYRLEK